MGHTKGLYHSKKSLVSFLLVSALISSAAFFFSGCAKECDCPKPECVCNVPECPVCECPVTEKSDCEPCICPKCEDSNQSRDEQETEVKTITRTKYVCPDNRVVDAAELCFMTEDNDFIPIKTNEDDSMIEEVSLTPTCIYGNNGGSIYFKVGTIAGNINFQVKDDASGEYNTVYSIKNLYDGYKTFEIVESSDSRTKGDFKLLRNRVYLFRIEFFLPAINEYQYSNEHIINTYDSSAFMSKKCS